MCESPGGCSDLRAPGLENRLLWGCCVGADMCGAGGAASLAGSAWHISTEPAPPSEPKSSAPNCTLSPDTSVEPGISTAEEGIWAQGGRQGAGVNQGRTQVGYKGLSRGPLRPDPSSSADIWNQGRFCSLNLHHRNDTMMITNVPSLIFKKEHL